MMKKILYSLLFSYTLSSFGGNANLRLQLLEEYYSVSYPLQSIKITSSYGNRTDPFSGTLSFHNGLDLSARYEDAYSIFDGEVLRTGYDNRSGHYVTMQYGEYTVSYCHLSHIVVKAGDYLLAGDMVGVTGSSGRSTGPHLHLTVRFRGKYKNPLTLLIYVREKRAEMRRALLGEGCIDLSLSPRSFISGYAPLAMEQMRRYGIPASVTLAQMILESEWGRSSLAREANNYFGIKCSSSWLAAGKGYIHRNDDSPNEKFCVFSSPEASMEYHSRLLMGARYSRCHQYSPTDHENWIKGIKAAGYASDPDYVSKCLSLIRKYKLHSYDQHV